jgi:hypothetical protein
MNVIAKSWNEVALREIAGLFGCLLLSWSLTSSIVLGVLFFILTCWITPVLYVIKQESDTSS